MRTKRSTTSRRLGMLAVAVALIAASGCAGGGGGDAADSDDGKSPLKKYLGYSPFDFGNGQGMRSTFVADGSAQELEVLAGPAMPVMSENADQRDAQIREVENLIADCMEKQGFSYVPYVPEMEEESDWDKALDLPPEKFAKRWGYGISTIDSVFATDQVADDDPNAKIYEKLSESAKKAYDRALYGDMSQGIVVTQDGELGEAGPPGGGQERRNDAGKGKKSEERQPGCAQQANVEVHGDGPDPEELSSFESLFEDVSALTKRLGRDPEVVEANARWSDCMADEGHTGLNAPEDARNSIEEKLMDADTERKREKLADEEIELATADHECAEQGLNDVRAEVARKLETEFVQDHKAELQRYRDFRTEQQDGGEKQSGDQGPGN